MRPRIPVVSGSAWRTEHLITAFVILALLSLPFLGAGHDDAWIMLFAGETLGKGQWFLNHNGATQEISTSVLGALLAGISAHLAPSGQAYAAWKVAAWLPAMLAGMGLFNIVRRYCDTRSAYYWIFVLCCIPQWHNWAWGGLESGLFWLLSLLFVLALAEWTQEPDCRSGWQVAALAFALPLTRADALWAPLTLLFAAAWAKPASARIRIMPGFCAILATLAFHALRRWLSGQWLPSPAYAKATLSVEGIEQGLSYLYQFHAQTPLHALLAITLPLSVWGVFRLLRCAYGASPGRPGLFEWAALLVLIIDATTIMVGGDWMGFHRFAVRSLLLKILVLALAADIAHKWLAARIQQLFVRNLLSTAFAALALTGWTADGVVEKPGLFKFASQISEDVPFSLDLIGYMQDSNIPLQRDIRALAPWLDRDLPALVEQARTAGSLPLVVASYQAGYFARELRQRFNANEVLFVDLAGLTERRIGSLPGPRSALGLSDGIFHLAETLAHAGNSLGHFLASCRPDVVYVLGATPNDIRLMASAGYVLSYDKTVLIDGLTHGAVILTKSSPPLSNKCTALLQSGNVR